ncbi:MULTISPECIES: MotE family protein [Brevibacillus]|uniref:MotE family protein n=1 Tax=Brevibacillus TaxID=55080 RepID=UPI0015EF7969|nr:MULTISPECIES: MotE family protein [Brevibacillus]MBA4532288.1 MotE family protein [Brevibacillus halotolerans]MCR8962426.1 MotE family protein [Brevibacillus laterosporus]MCZ0834581.1 MotE family protein [Brevibacillus halotolerans]
MEEEIQEEREYNRLEWLLYIIVIPALFASLLAGILASLLGYDVVGSVKDWLNNIPYVEKLIPDDTPTSQTVEGSKEDSKTEAKKAQVNEEAAKSKQAADQLHKEVSQKDSTIASLQKQIANLQKATEEKRIEEEERQKQFQDLAKIYSTMSAKNAAAIVSNLSKEEAVVVLSKMKTDQQAQLLAKMDPKKAADISILLKDNQISKDDDIAALQQRVQILTKALSETRESSKIDAEKLMKSFESMNAGDASKILISLYKINSERALSVLGQVSDNKRGEFLSEISKTNPELAARLTNALPR